jgi:hypothetical protein
MAIASHGMTKTQYHHVIKIPKQYMSAPTKSPAALYVVRVTSVMMTRGVRARPMNRGGRELLRGGEGMGGRVRELEF